MTDEMIALARRAVSCKAWRWMPGMADQFGRRVMQVYPDELGFRWSHLLENNVVRDADALPDLTDPATLGCLLALVREAWDGGLLGVAFDYDNGEWAVRRRERSALTYGKGMTEAEALVAALEAAPNTSGEYRREGDK